MTRTASRSRKQPKPRWMSYAHATKAEHFAYWSDTRLVQSVDRFAGSSLKLEPWQLAFFEEALAVEADGRPYWRQVVLVVPRKNGKTSMLAAYGLYHLLEDEGSPEVLLAASSDKQAGRLFDSTVSFVRRNEDIDGLVHRREYIGEIARVDGMGRIIRMASDPGRAHGYNPSLVVTDELHAWTTPSLRKAWGAFTTGGGARGSSQVFAITTAGDAQERESSILGQIIDRNESAGEVERPHDALTVSRNHEARTIVFNYSAPTSDRRDVGALKRANPASWITEEYLRQQAESPALSDAEVLQLHGCVWAASDSSWLPAGAWDACADGDRQVEDGTRVVLGFDGSASNDSTALIGCTVEETPHLFVVGVWERPSMRREWRVPRGEVDLAVREAMHRWDVVEFAADPPLWRSELEQWSVEHRDATFIAYDTRQLSTMGDACSRLYSAVVEGRVTHDGSDVLAAHMANCQAKETRWGAVVTKPKGSPHKIDAAVAAIAAHDRAVVCGETGSAFYVSYDELLSA